MSGPLVAGVSAQGAEASASHASDARLTYEAFTRAAPAAHAVALGTINQWNRIAVALRFPPPVARAPGAR